MDIFSPDNQYRLEIRILIENKLREKFSKGIYTKREDILNILNFIYECHYNEICNVIKGVNSKEVISYLLYQLELIENADIKHRRVENVVLFKETIFYLLDLFVEKNNHETSNSLYFHENEFFHKLWIHAKKCIEYVNASNHASMVCPNTSEIELFPDNSDLFIKQSESNNFDRNFDSFQRDVQNNIKLRDRILGSVDLQQIIFELVSDDKNTGFEEKFGLTYLEFEFIFLDLIKNSKKINRITDIPCLSVKDITNISNQLNISRENICDLLGGISLTDNHFETRKREIWDFVQQERSRKRPLIELNYEGEKWLLFSPKMLGNRICGLAEDLILSPQNRIPKEWNTTNINRKFSHLNTKIGVWFETLTQDLLERVGVVGFKPGNRLRLSENETIALEANIGPADFIGYSAELKTVIVIECKLLDCVFDSKGIRSELSKFLTNKKCYTKKFKEKIEWTIENFEKVKAAIEYQKNIKIPTECNQLNYCFVTYYPTITKYFYDEIPILTLAELIESLSEKRSWSFNNGKISI